MRHARPLLFVFGLLALTLPTHVDAGDTVARPLSANCFSREFTILTKRAGDRVLARKVTRRSESPRW